MKIVGFILIAIGVALLLFVLISAILEGNQLKSPVPEDKGVKILFISPTQ